MSLPYQNSVLPPEQRAEDLLARMTLEEKVDQLSGMGQENSVYGDKAAKFFGTRENTRLGIPAYIMGHGITAARSGRDHTPRATYFCSPSAIAASWDTELYRDVGTAMAREMRAMGQHLNLGPTINIIRHPLGGRSWECFSEDPYLTARMIVAYSQAMQANGIVCGPKHYAANNQELHRRDINNVVDERTLREIYLSAFEAAIKEGGALNVMGAYNRVNGAYMCENKPLLMEVLRKEWGFRGFTVSDFTYGVRSTVGAIEAGLNVEMHMTQFYGPALVAAVRNGDVSEATVDQRVREKLYVMFKMGAFENAYAQPPEILHCAAHQEITARVARSSPVLLKNEGGLLPLRRERIRSVAVIGPNAKPFFVLNPGEARPYKLNAYTHYLQGGGSGKCQYIASALVDPFAGIERGAGPGIEVRYARGCLPVEKTDPNPAEDERLIAEAVAVARTVDVAVLVMGLSAHSEKEGVDRLTARLPGAQDDLIRAVVAANPKTVVVLIAGSYVDLNPWLDLVPGVLFCFYSGERVGQGIAEVLFGDVSPSGKLPISYPVSVDQYPAGSIYTGGPYSETGVDNVYAEGVFVGYRYLDAHASPVLFPFGFGLSYTTFAYSALEVTPGVSRAGESIEVACVVANTGTVAGDEIVQLYVRDVVASVPRPPRELKGFRRVSLQPGERKTVTFTLNDDAFAFYDETRRQWTVEPGEFEIQIGASSRDIRLNGTLTKRDPG